MARFKPGRVVVTQVLLDRVHGKNVDLGELLVRHLGGDWGDVSPEDAALNEQSILDGERIHSVYHVDETLTIWIITDAGHEVTTLLLPEDY